MKNLKSALKATFLIATLSLSASIYADSALDAAKQPLEEKDPKQCLNELKKDKAHASDGTDELVLTEEQKAELLEKKKLSWFEKVVKQHKLGSLHFQDIIELFH